MTSPAHDRLAYPIEEARQLMGGLSRSKIYKEINAGRLTTFRAGGRRLVSEAAIRSWIADLEAETAAVFGRGGAQE